MITRGTLSELLTADLGACCPLLTSCLLSNMLSCVLYFLNSFYGLLCMFILTLEIQGDEIPNNNLNFVLV